MELRTQYKDTFVKKHNVKLGFMSAFVKATSYSLAQQPIVNAVIEDKEIVYRDYHDISVAVSSPKVIAHSYIYIYVYYSKRMNHH